MYLHCRKDIFQQLHFGSNILDENQDVAENFKKLVIKRILSNK